MLDKRIWLLGVPGLAVALTAWAALTALRRHGAWLRHRRGERKPGEERVEREPQPGDILLFHHGPRLRDLLITWVTHSPFYHTALYAGDMHVVEARPKGVIHGDLQGREHHFVVVPAPEGKGKAALDWATGQIGSKFDRTDFLVILLEHLFTHWHINYNPRGRYTCAELVATAFENTGVRLVPEKQIDEIEPGDLARLIPDDERPQSLRRSGARHGRRPEPRRRPSAT